MTVEPTKEGLAQIDPSYFKMWLVVSYSATVNSDASPTLGDVGNTHHVQLTWKRTSMDYIDQLEDRARVYNFGINLKKEFAQSDKVGDATKGATEDEGTTFSPAANGTSLRFGQ